MCLALENWLFLRKKRFLTCYFLPFYFVSNSSFFFSYLVSYLLLFVWLCAVYVCVYELLAIKYIESQPNFHRSLCECVLNCLLLYLESFGLFSSSFSKPHSSSFIMHIILAPRKEKSLIIKLIDFSAFSWFYIFSSH